MPKTKISEFDVDPANNTDINSINIAEGCAPSGINNAIRQLMSDLKEQLTGASGDPFTVGGAFAANGGATLGDASGDALTINSSAVSIPNGLNFGSNNLVLSSGNVGIGTSSPVSIAGYTIQTLNNGTSGSGTYYQQAATSIGRVLVTSTEMYVGSNGAYPLILTTNAAERMRITGSGDVGIGTTSTSGYKLAVSDGTTYSVVHAGGGASYYGAITNNPVLFIQNNTERMRIDSSGNLLVGKTAAAATSVGFQVDGTGALYTTKSTSTNADATYYLYSTGASAYRFYVGLGGTISATSTTITGISDQRVKENIIDLDDGLDAVMALKPRKFDWKAGKGKDIKGDRGFIAQEFETVFPDMIEEWRDPAPEGEEPYKAVNANLIPTLVKAIQEQQAIITDLKARLEALENK